ncbi:hypothetical protein VP01_2416g5 [Puccinia sorghi]|uniref:Uncharacterized protein n=1 Tax=Puccinia sorghi TaxID=27349 RepID=A0A0L6V6Q5_9BASI|nr:hypothetical protein VP01_2416g5 [Puccinia sorghi]
METVTPPCTNQCLPHSSKKPLPSTTSNFWYQQKILLFRPPPPKNCQLNKNLHFADIPNQPSPFKMETRHPPIYHTTPLPLKSLWLSNQFGYQFLFIRYTVSIFWGLGALFLRNNWVELIGSFLSLQIMSTVDEILREDNRLELISFKNTKGQRLVPYLAPARNNMQDSWLGPSQINPNNQHTAIRLSYKPNKTGPNRLPQLTTCTQTAQIHNHFEILFINTRSTNSRRLFGRQEYRTVPGVNSRMDYFVFSIKIGLTMVFAWKNCMGQGCSKFIILGNHRYGNKGNHIVTQDSEFTPFLEAIPQKLLSQGFKPKLMRIVWAFYTGLRMRNCFGKSSCLTGGQCEYFQLYPLHLSFSPVIILDSDSGGKNCPRSPSYSMDKLSLDLKIQFPIFSRTEDTRPTEHKTPNPLIQYPTFCTLQDQLFLTPLPVPFNFTLSPLFLSLPSFWKMNHCPLFLIASLFCALILTLVHYKKTTPTDTCLCLVSITLSSTLFQVLPLSSIFFQVLPLSSLTFQPYYPSKIVPFIYKYYDILNNLQHYHQNTLTSHLFFPLHPSKHLQHQWVQLHSLIRVENDWIVTKSFCFNTNVMWRWSEKENSHKFIINIWCGIL